METYASRGVDEVSRAPHAGEVGGDEEGMKTVETLASQVASRPLVPVAATKAHVNAVTAQMVGAARAWSDADSLIGGLLDPECEAARQAYVKARGR